MPIPDRFYGSGTCEFPINCARTWLKESREQELNALIDPEVRRVLDEQRVIVTDYSNLS
jgi:hypothetical protein